MFREIGAASLLLGFALAFGQPAMADDKLRIGFLTDMSGAYADLDGKNGATAIQMAIDDFGGKVNGMPIELLASDHQNKPDIGVATAREWMDSQHISVLVGGTNSAVAVAVAGIAAEKKVLFIANGPGTSALSNEACNPFTIHYAYDTVAIARGTAGAMVKQGYKDWYFLTADYAFGAALQRDALAVITAGGGRMIGSVKHPVGTPDFSAYLVQAAAAKPQILGIANGGNDMVNTLKAIKEFGLDQNMKVASLLMFITDVHSMGLQDAGGLLFTTSWDWNLNDESRAFGRRFYAKTGRKPTDVQAADYSSTMTYLKTVQTLNTAGSEKVMAYLKSTKLEDFYAEGYVRADGRYVHNMYLMQVKTPAESHEPWDYVKVVATMPGEEVFTTKAETRCPLWK
jgi:branched-chain amino acid transport system substrate-binding protein